MPGSGRKITGLLSPNQEPEGWGRIFFFPFRWRQNTPEEGGQPKGSLLHTDYHQSPLSNGPRLQEYDHKPLTASFSSEPGSSVKMAPVGPLKVVLLDIGIVPAPTIGPLSEQG